MKQHERIPNLMTSTRPVNTLHLLSEPGRDLGLVSVTVPRTSKGRIVPTSVLGLL